MATTLVEFSHQLQQMEDRFAATLPVSSITPGRLIESVRSCCERTPKLLDCTRDSLIMGALTAANFGLTCDGVTGQSWMIPRKDKGTLKAQWQVGYKGIITLAGRSSWILSATEVREKDPFRIIEGTQPRIDHEIIGMNQAERGKVIGVYALARSNHYPAHFEWMNEGEILQIRNNHAFTKQSSSPWKEHTLIMYKKTVMLALGRRLPIEMVNSAVTLEQNAEMGRFAHVDDQGQIHVEGAPRSPEAHEPEETVEQRLNQATDVTPGMSV